MNKNSTRKELPQGIKVTGKIEPRWERREKKVYEAMLLALINDFLNYRMGDHDEKELTQELNRLDGHWKHFVTKWNNNLKRRSLLRTTDFLQCLNDQLTRLENETK